MTSGCAILFHFILFYILLLNSEIPEHNPPMRILARKQTLVLNSRRTSVVVYGHCLESKAATM